MTGERRRNVFEAVNAKPRRFRPPPIAKAPDDIAARLEWAADGADEIGLSKDGLRGGSKLLRDAAAEIRRLRAMTRTEERDDG